MVLGETGHQDLPDAARTYVERVLQSRLSRTPDLEGVTSLAAGADQLFAAAVFAAGGRLRVVVPCEGYESTFHDPRELLGYRTFLKKASHVERLEYSEPSEAAFYAAGRRVVDLCDALVAVWDRQEARGHGGTADVVRYARQQEKKVEVIWPGDVDRS